MFGKIPILRRSYTSQRSVLSSHEGSQFPVKVAYAMTISKSQGQSLGRVGLYLPRPVFGHGQLYVALSRSGNPPAGRLGVRIVAVDTGDGVQGRHHTLAGVYTRNVVYREVLQ